MYRLILVDDEEIVLRGIQKVFRLEDYQFQTVGTFTNPARALKELPTLSPHLIITDIKMPAMDGLTFATQAKQLLPDVEIVILSGYDDFAYARTAMKIGVSDYLLKPIKKQDFAKMLETMQEKISAREGLSRQLSALKNITMSNYATLRNKFFLTIAEQGSPMDDSMEALYEQLGFCFKGCPFILVKFVIYEMNVAEDYMSALETLMTEFTLHMKDYGFFEEFYTDEYLYFYIYDIDLPDFSRDTFCQRVYDFTDRKTQEGIRLLSGVSQTHEDLPYLFFAVSECDEDILTADTDYPDSESKSDTFPGTNGELHLPYREMENLFLGITTNDPSMISENVRIIFSVPAASLYRDYCYSIAHILLLRLGHMQKKYSVSQPIITPDLFNSRLLRQRYASSAQLKELVEKKSLEICRLISSCSSESPSKTILSALSYIEQHFNENISLSDVAEHIFISKNYLCDLFKKELNLTFIDYVTNLRIEKAKYYLSQTDMKMYEISQAVGYNDYAYFSQIFKRHTGSTLSSYRKQH